MEFLGHNARAMHSLMIDVLVRFVRLTALSTSALMSPGGSTVQIVLLRMTNVIRVRGCVLQVEKNPTVDIGITNSYVPPVNVGKPYVEESFNMGSRPNKIIKTYRQKPEVVALVRMAAAELRMSEADIVDMCITEELGNVLRRELRRPAGLTELIKEADTLKDRRTQSAKEALEQARAKIRKAKELS